MHLQPRRKSPLDTRQSFDTLALSSPPACAVFQYLSHQSRYLTESADDAVKPVQIRLVYRRKKATFYCALMLTHQFP
jgi:hypothetical protein